MKFCVMMAAQSNAVVNVGGVLREEGVGENMVRLKVAVTPATAAHAITCEDRSGPSLTRAKVSERLLGAAVNVVGVTLTLVLLRQHSRLIFAPFAPLRARRAVTVPVLERLEQSAANLTASQLSVFVGQRFVDAKKNVFVLAYATAVFTQINCSLSIRIKGFIRFAHHVRVAALANFVTEVTTCDVFATPQTVLLNHLSPRGGLCSTTNLSSA